MILPEPDKKYFCKKQNNVLPLGTLCLDCDGLCIIVSFTFKFEFQDIEDIDYEEITNTELPKGQLRLPPREA